MQDLYIKKLSDIFMEYNWLPVTGSDVTSSSFILVIGDANFYWQPLQILI